MKRKGASIHDVAARAGVSIATVSRVINGRDCVSRATAQAVKSAIRQLKYRPNTRARALSRRRSDAIGLILPDFFGDFYGRLMEGVDAEARQAGLRLIVTRARDPLAKCDEAEQLLFGGAVDGAIVMVDQRGEAGLKRLELLRAPVVVLDRDVGHRRLDNVLVDNVSAGYEATHHLIAVHGTADLLFVGGPRQNFDTVERASGFRNALRAAGVTPRSRLFFSSSYDYESGAETARAILASPVWRQGPRGFVVANDDLARGLIDAMAEQGFSAPGDIAVVSFDDSRLAEFGRPMLTTVRPPLEEVGRVAVKIILDRLADPQSQPVKSALRGRLIVRASCGCGPSAAVG